MSVFTYCGEVATGLLTTLSLEGTPSIDLSAEYLTNQQSGRKVFSMMEITRREVQTVKLDL